MVSQPRIVVAATRSGDGKTTVATGLMAALRAAGLRVSAHKVGPDYIDPSYHAAATGRPGRNLDPWLVGEERIAPLFLHGARGADIAIIEGVMGLFDGAAGRGDFASTAHVARLLDAPIVLVVTASGAGRSIAATVHGFATFDPAVRIAGVVLNQVSSARHEQILREALADAGIPVLGALPAEAILRTPSRHLGLVPAAERGAEVRDWLPPLRELVARHLDLDRLTAIARSAPPLTALPWSAADHGGALGAGGADGADGADGAPVRVAVAAGPAFTFGYAEHAELLAAAGAEVAEFDPITAADAPGRDRRAGGRGRLPRALRRRTRGQRRVAGRGQGPGGRGDAGHRRVRGPALARPRTRREPAVRRAARCRDDDREADPRLPGGGRPGIKLRWPRPGRWSGRTSSTARSALPRTGPVPRGG